MEFTTYGMQQLALGNDAKFRAIVGLAMDIAVHMVSEARQRREPADTPL